MASPFEFETDAEAKRVLREEGKRLKKIARKVWLEYEGSYTPSKYVRTGNSLKSIKLGNVFKVDDNTWGIELTFQNDLAYHNSVLKSKSGKKHKKGHSIMLISSGWIVKKGKHKNIYRFGYYESKSGYQGFDYIGKVVNEFNSGKHQGISLEVQWSGKYLK